MHDFLHPPFETPIDLMLASDKAYVAEVEERARREVLIKTWSIPDTSGSMSTREIQQATERMSRQVGSAFRDASRIMARAGAKMTDVQRRMAEIQRRTLVSLDHQGDYQLPAVPPRNEKPALLVSVASLILIAIAATILGAFLL